MAYEVEEEAISMIRVEEEIQTTMGNVTRIGACKGWSELLVLLLSFIAACKLSVE